MRAVREADNRNFLSTHGVPNRFSAEGVLTSIGRESMRNIIDDNEKNNASLAKYSYEKVKTSFRICVIDKAFRSFVGCASVNWFIKIISISRNIKI